MMGVIGRGGIVYGRTEIVLEPSDFGVQTCEFPDSVDLFVPMMVV